MSASHSTFSTDATFDHSWYEYKYVGKKRYLLTLSLLPCLQKVCRGRFADPSFSHNPKRYFIQAESASKHIISFNGASTLISGFTGCELLHCSPSFVSSKLYANRCLQFVRRIPRHLLIPSTISCSPLPRRISKRHYPSTIDLLARMESTTGRNYGVFISFLGVSLTHCAEMLEGISY